jgi:hypothetical protein
MKKRTRRTKEQIAIDNANKLAEEINRKEIEALTKEVEEEVKAESKGLGDTIEKITEATGIKRLVKFIAGEDCGCEERKLKLNRLFPYQKPLCLTEGEYEYLTNYFTTCGNTIKVSQQEVLLKIFNRVMRDGRKPTSCADCWREIHLTLKKVYNAYESN